MDKNFNVEKDILIFALRYSLGRRTFAPVIAIENIKANIDKFNKRDLEQIIEDIQYQKKLEAFLGDPVDVEHWENFVEYLEKIIAKKTALQKEDTLWKYIMHTICINITLK